MARTANRYLQSSSSVSNHISFKTALYLRLSVESKRTDSDSIENQRLIINDYLSKNQELNQDVHEYIDDGKSGTNFERTNFQCLINDIKVGMINCIIVKDLSRFARNYIEAGEYLEHIFPYLGIRFISLAEEYDSADPNCTRDQLSMNLKNLVNELYAKDGSKKIHSSYRIKQESKIFYRSSTIPYGYKMGRDNYLPDENTLPYVKMIFEEYNNGASKYEISKMLNDLGTVPPKKYRETGAVKRSDTDTAEYWHLSTIHRILTNEAYIGNLIRHKTEQRLFEDMPSYIVPKKDWICIEDNHPPIIARCIFDQVQQRLLETKKKYPMSGKSTNIKTLGHDPENIFAGTIYCGCCGKGMGRISKYTSKNNQKTRYMAFQCRNYRNNHSCENIEMINEIDLYELVVKVIIKQIKVINNYTDVIEGSIEQVFKSKIEKSSEALDKVQNQIMLQRNQKMLKYADFVEERIERDEYAKWKMECAALQLKLEKERKKTAETIRQLHALKSRTVKSLDKYIKNGKLGMQKEDIQFFVDRIIFYGQNRIEIKLNFKEVWDMLKEKTRGENLA